MPKYTFTVSTDNELSEQDLEALVFMWRDGIEEWTKKGLVPAKNFAVLSWEQTKEDA
jgi:hypothetical protein